MERGAISRRPLVKSLSVGFIATNAYLIARRTMPAFFFHLSSSFHFLPRIVTEASNVRMIDFYFESIQKKISLPRFVPNHRLLLNLETREKSRRRRGRRRKIERVIFAQYHHMILLRGELCSISLSTKRAFDRLT